MCVLLMQFGSGGIVIGIEGCGIGIEQIQGGIGIGIEGSGGIGIGIEQMDLTPGLSTISIYPSHSQGFVNDI